MRHGRWFTLIELLVIVAMVAILVGLLLPPAMFTRGSAPHLQQLEAQQVEARQVVPLLDGEGSGDCCSCGTKPAAPPQN